MRRFLFSLAIALTALATSVSAQEKKVKVGDKAPAFSAPDETGKTFDSKDVVGKKVVVLYFYPADFTGGCTKQACGYRDETVKLKDVVVLGVSGDSVKTHALFKKDHMLPFTLLADEKGEVAKAFGVPVKVGEFKATGKDSAGKAIELVRSASAERYTVVIDKSGKIADVHAVGKGAAEDPKRVTKIVENLK